MTRVRALLRKELAELARHPGIFAPAVLTGLVALAMPFVLAVGVPLFTGEALSASGDVQIAEEMYRERPAMRALSPEAAIQAWIFEQFLIFLTLAPVAASMTIAAHSIVGEKQARTLEPLLATPITTLELLGAKILAAFIPALALTAAISILYLGGIAIMARPGVAGALAGPASALVLGVVGPLAALAALQLAVCVSSRVNDVRAAQQVGALVILPMAALLVLQLLGTVRMTIPLILAIALGLTAANVLLLWMGTWLFDREAIVTRWR